MGLTLFHCGACWQIFGWITFRQMLEVPLPAMPWWSRGRQALRDWLVQKLRPHSQTMRWAHRAYLCLPEGWRLTPAEIALRHLDRYPPEDGVVYFVQIGANDGVAGDPLGHLLAKDDSPWRGILVEPLPEAFEVLCARHASKKGLSMVRAVITDHDGEAAFYRPCLKAGLPPEAQHLASLDPRIVLSHENDYGGKLGASLERIAVPGLTLATLLERHHLPRMDALIIDAEGADAAILRQLDLARWRPSIVIFECRHLKAADREWCATTFTEAGYRLQWTFQDAVATCERPLTRRPASRPR
jgi:FkbM family methyltransferase